MAPDNGQVVSFHNRYAVCQGSSRMVDNRRQVPNVLPTNLATCSGDDWNVIDFLSRAKYTIGNLFETKITRRLIAHGLRLYVRILRLKIDNRLFNFDVK